MSNDIDIKQNPLSGIPSLQQTGTNNVHVTNEEGGNIYFNFNYPQSMTENSAETMIAIQRFSTQYYQLIVTCEEDVFSLNSVSISSDRALTKWSVPEEIFFRCSSLSDAGIEELKTFPAIICQENRKMHGKTDPDQWAMFAHIQHVQKSGRTIKIAFHPIRPFPQSQLCQKRNAIFFDLNMDCAITDLNRSAWSVHKVNIFEAFEEAGLSMPKPMSI